MKTKGALVWDLNQPWAIDEIEIGDPRRGEVTVQLETAGLCHSDHHLLTGDFGACSPSTRSSGNVIRH